MKVSQLLFCIIPVWCPRQNERLLENEWFLRFLQKQWKTKQNQHFRGNERFRVTAHAPWSSRAEGHVPMKKCWKPLENEGFAAAF